MMLLWSALAAMSKEMVEALVIEAASDPHFILNHPAILDPVDLTGSGSLTAALRVDDVMQARAMTSLSEGSYSYASRTVAASKPTVAAGLYYSQFETSVHAATAQDGQLDPERFVASIMKGEAYTWTGLLATAGSTFTTVAGDLSAAPAADDLVDALNGLANGAYTSEGAIVVCHPNVVKSLQKDIEFTQLSNAVVHDPEWQKLAKVANGASYVGRIKGADIFQTPQVPTASGKYINSMWIRGGVGTCRATPPVELADQMVLGRVRFHKLLSSGGGGTVTRGETFMGVTKAYNTFGAVWKTPV